MELNKSLGMFSVTVSGDTENVLEFIEYLGRRVKFVDNFFEGDYNGDGTITAEFEVEGYFANLNGDPIVVDDVHIGTIL